MSSIGIFDSGVGGLTVLGALRRRLPAEDFVYLGDTARLPYGTKSAATVQRYAVNAANRLAEHGVKLLIIACNTASSYALDAVVAALSIPVVGVVSPGAKAAIATGARRIGVIGTEGTIRSGAYQAAIGNLDPDIDIESIACPLFVPLAEEGWGDHPVTDEVARHYLTPLLEWGADTIILGCTHYPLLTPSLQRVVGSGMALVDSAGAVAETVAEEHADRLAASSESGTVRLELTDASQRFLRITRSILGRDPEHLEIVDI